MHPGKFPRRTLRPSLYSANGAVSSIAYNAVDVPIKGIVVIALEYDISVLIEYLCASFLPFEVFYVV